MYKEIIFTKHMDEVWSVDAAGLLYIHSILYLSFSRDALILYITLNLV